MGLFDKLFSAFKKSGKDVEGQLDDAAKIVMEKASELKDIAADKMEEMAPMVDKAKETLSEKLGEAGEVLSDAKDKATAKFEEFSTAADKDAKETAEKGDNLEELMQNSHLDALKNTKLTGEHEGKPIEDAVTERIDELKGHATETTKAVKDDYNQDLVLPDLPTETTTESVVSETVTPPPPPSTDKIGGLIEAPDSEEVALPTTEGVTEKLEAAKDSITETVADAKDSLTDNLELPTTDGVTDQLDAIKDSMDEKVQGVKDGLADQLDTAKGKIAGVGAGIAGAAGGLGGSDLKDKAEEILGDTSAKLDDTLTQAKDLGGQLEDQANAIKEKHLKAAESMEPEIIEEVEAIEVEPEDKDPNDEPSFGDLVDDAKDALFGFKDSINKKID